MSERIKRDNVADINESIFMYVLEVQKVEFAASQRSHVFPPLRLIARSLFSHGMGGKGREKNLNSFTAATREFNSYVWQINETMKSLDRASERERAIDNGC